MTAKTIGLLVLLLVGTLAPGAATMSTGTSALEPGTNGSPADSAAAGKTPAVGAPAPPSGTTATDNTIAAIRVEAGSLREERISFFLNGVLPPVMFFLEGEPIRLVCDFLGAQLAAEVPQEIEVGGKLILRVRTGLHEAPQRKVRVVVELCPGREYEIDEYFRPQESRYDLFIRPAGGIAPADGD